MGMGLRSAALRAAVELYYNKVLGLANDFLQPVQSYSKMY